MTPEQLSRLRTYDPDYDNPDPWPRRRPKPRLLTARGRALLICVAILPLLAGFLVWGRL